jgi:hypothetical protein
MAEATLNDVVNRLRTDNAKQLESQRDTTEAVSALTGSITALLTQLELNALKQKELDAEKRKATSGASKAATAESPIGDFGIGSMFAGIAAPLAALGSSLLSIASFGAALALATEGLGPALRDVTRFIRTIRRVFTFPATALANLGRVIGTGSLASYLARQLRSFEQLVGARYSFDGRNFQRLMRSGGGTGFVAGRDISLYQRTLARLNRAFSQIGRAFQAIRIPSEVVRSITRTASSITSALGIRSLAGGAAGAVRGIANSPLFKRIMGFLRPIAAIFSIFDGIENATEELEDREGLFNRLIGGGLGGFVSGFFGSFFGELGNAFKDLPLWVIKQFIPADFLNDDGTFKRTEDGGSWFTSLLAGVEQLDFNRLLTGLIQAPFDMIGHALDFVRNLLGASGTSEEGQARAREAWDTWWSNWTSVSGAAGNVTDILSWIANLAFAPLNAVLREIETAFFGADENRESQTFTERVTGYISRIGDFLGDLFNIDRLKEILANALPARVARFLGLGDYRPLETGEVEDALGNMFEGINDSIENINRLESQLATLDPNTNPDYDNVAAQLETERRELNQDRQEAEALLARAGRSENVNQNVVNNYQQQYESFMFPNSGPIDDTDDPRR